MKTRPLKAKKLQKPKPTDDFIIGVDMAKPGGDRTMYQEPCGCRLILLNGGGDVTEWCVAHMNRGRSHLRITPDYRKSR